MAEPEKENGGLFGVVKHQLAETFEASITLMFEGFKKLYDASILGPKNYLNKLAALILDTGWDKLLNFWEEKGLIDKEDRAALKPMTTKIALIDIIFYVFIFLQVNSSFILSYTRIISGTMRQTFNAKHTPEVPYYGDMIQAAFTAPEKYAQVHNALRRSGISDADIDLLFLSRYQLYNEGVVKDLSLRGVIDKKTTKERLHELGYTATRINELVQAWNVIPGPADILHMVAKEAFEPDAVLLMGLDDEFPKDQTQWLEKKGLSEFWAKQYWRAHWELPGVQLVHEMYHRGIIGEPGLDMYYRTAEFAPYWRKRIKAVAFNVFTRVDTRRMHKLGVLTDAELVRSYQDQGYDDDKAVKMAEFTIRYNAQGERNVTMSQIIKGYNLGSVKRVDAIALLITIGYTTDHAEYLLVLEDTKINTSLIEDQIDNIAARYQDNLINRITAQGELQTLGVDHTTISRYLTNWDTNKLIDRKKPSKADLEKFIKWKIIGEATWRSEMRGLGYGGDYIEWYWKYHKETQKAAVSV